MDRFGTNENAGQAQQGESIIYVLWMGENDMSYQRREALNSIVENSGVKVELVMLDNLKKYIEEPIHPAFPYLSTVHQSDYFRAYLLNGHGGGYMDVKFCSGSWAESFRDFYASKYQIVGYKELEKKCVARVGGKEYVELRNNYHKLIGCGAYIARPSDFTRKWMERVNALLDRKYEKLKQNRGNLLGDNRGYPLAWTELLGNILQPLCLEMMGKVGFDDRIKPDFKRVYR